MEMRISSKLLDQNNSDIWTLFLQGSKKIHRGGTARMADATAKIVCTWPIKDQRDRSRHSKRTANRAQFFRASLNIGVSGKYLSGRNDHSTHSMSSSYGLNSDLTCLSNKANQRQRHP